MLAHALFPFDGAGLGIEAVGDTGVGNLEQVAAFNQGRWHIRDAFVGAPHDVGIGDVAAPAPRPDAGCDCPASPTCIFERGGF